MSIGRLSRRIATNHYGRKWGEFKKKSPTYCLSECNTRCVREKLNLSNTLQCNGWMNRAQKQNPRLCGSVFHEVGWSCTLWKKMKFILTTLLIASTVGALKNLVDLSAARSNRLHHLLKGKFYLCSCFHLNIIVWFVDKLTKDTSLSYLIYELRVDIILSKLFFSVEINL